jgi:hypothetical protein
MVARSYVSEPETLQDARLCGVKAHLSALVLTACLGNAQLPIAPKAGLLYLVEDEILLASDSRA